MIAREKLRLLGVADKEIDAMEHTGQAPQRLVIRSPHGGHVFEKRIVEGDRVQAGQMLFEVADLSTVWVEADVYEKDVGLLRAGQLVGNRSQVGDWSIFRLKNLAMQTRVPRKHGPVPLKSRQIVNQGVNGYLVDVSIEAFPGRVFGGRLRLIHPHVETATRTLRVRLELENPDHMLRPGMFATVRLSVPVVELEPFRSMLAARDRATAATDDATLAGMQKVCPVTGAKLGTMGPPVRVTVHGRSVLLCCAGCEEELREHPDGFLDRLSVVGADGVLSIPETAVIDTGSLEVAYVEREPGLFEGVPVTLGPRSGVYYAVIDGLAPGDRVAAAGAFLVDAETRLNPTAAAAYFGASGGPSTATGAPGHDHGTPATPKTAEKDLEP